MSSDQTSNAPVTQAEFGCGTPAGSPRTIESTDLLHGDREVHIQHGQQVYRLRVTRAGKLILNK